MLAYYMGVVAMCKMVNLKTNIDTQVRISEYKTDQIRNLIISAALCKDIKQIILFGSTLASNCSKESDIDFVIISDLSVAQLSRKKSFREFLEQLYMADDFRTDYDILYFKSMDEILNNQTDLICSEISSKGKLIYDRNGVAA